MHHTNKYSCAALKSAQNNNVNEHSAQEVVLLKLGRAISLLQSLDANVAAPPNGLFFDLLLKLKKRRLGGWSYRLLVFRLTIWLNLLRLHFPLNRPRKKLQLKRKMSNTLKAELHFEVWMQNLSKKDWRILLFGLVGHAEI